MRKQYSLVTSRVGERRAAPARWKRRLQCLCHSKVFLSVGLLTVLTSLPSFPQMDRLYEPWRWVRFGVSSGLPSEDILSIVETEDGTPWVLTRRGLAWFDGFRWNSVDLGTLKVPFGEDFQLDAESTAVSLWTQRRLFLVTQSGSREIRLSGGEMFTNIAFLFGRGRLATYLNYRVNVVEHDSLVPFPSPVDLVPLDERQKQFSDFVLTHSGKRLWLKVRNVLYRWNDTGWVEVFRNRARYLKLPLQENVRAPVREDDDGNVVALLEDQPGYISVYEASRGELLRKNLKEIGDQISCMELSPSGDVLSLNSSGDLRLRRRGMWASLSPRPSPIMKPTFLRFRKTGDLWVGTQNGLYLCRLSSERWVVWRSEIGSREDIVSEICPTHDGSVWVGTGNGVRIYSANGAVKTVQTINGHPIGRIIGIAEDQEKNVWISSGTSFEGAYRWDGRSWHHFGPRDGLDAPRVHRLVKDRRGRVWFLGIGTGILPGGPGAFVLDNGRFVRWGQQEGLLDGRVYTMVEDHNGGLWFGTYTGLSKWKNGKWTYWRQENGLKAQRVFGLAVDSRNNIYLCHQAGGVGVIDEHDSLYYYTSADGLISDNVWGLAVDEADRLWAATWNGLGCFSAGQWLSFDVNSGLPHPRLWPVVPVGRKVYLGTQGAGIAILTHAFGEMPPPKVSFEPPSFLDREVTLRWTVDAYWGDTPPTLIPCRIRLDRGAWSPEGFERQTRYRSLSSGTHTIEVRVRGAYGEVHPASASLSFDVEPPFYARPVFYVPLGSIGLMLGALGLVYRQRRRRYEEAIRLGEQRFVLQYKRNPVPILTVQKKNESFRLIDFNDAAQAITSGQIAEFVGSPLGNLRQFLPEVVPAVETCYQEQSTVRTDGRLTLGGGGQPLDLVLTCAYVPPDMVLVHARDVTFEKRAASEIQESQNQLRALTGRVESIREEERKQLSQEIHDELGQIITGLKMDLSWIGKRAPDHFGDSASVVSERIQRMNTLADAMLDSVRSLAGRLRPVVLDKLGLVAAIEWQAREMESRTGIVCMMDPFAKEPPLSHEKGTEIFRVFQEILTNVVRHAEATTVNIDIREHRGQFILTVTDDGRGFRVGDRKGDESLGILGMEERLRRIGGWLRIQSEISKGTSVVVCVPLDKEIKQ